MKTLLNLNIFHTSLAQDLTTLIGVNNAGNLASEDIQFICYDKEDTQPFGIKHPMNAMAAGYENYSDAVEDYLKLQVILGYRTTDNLWELVKADYEDDEGNLIVVGCYTNDPNEEKTVIATVLSDTTVEDRSGDPVGTIFQFGEKANKVISDAVIRQNQRNETLVQAVHDNVVKQVNEGDTTVLEGLLQKVPHAVLLNSLSEDDWKKFGCKSSV